MKRKAVKNGLKIAVFLLLVLWIGSYWYQVLLYKPSGGEVAQRFYRMEKETSDVVCFGSSHCNCTINNAILWEDYGIASYSMTAAGQQMYSTYYYVKESIRRQEPKVALVELYMAGDEEAVYDEGSVYRNTLGMKWTPEYLYYVNELGNMANLSAERKKEIMLRFPIVHSRYRELNANDFEDELPYMRGYYGSDEVTPHEIPAACYEKDSLEMNAENEKYLRKIISLCKESDTKLILFVAPYILEEDVQKRYNRAKEIAAEEEIPFVNFNEVEMCQLSGFDFGSDMREESHVNNSGSEKITRYLAAMIQEHAEIPDRRGQEGYELWEDHARYLKGRQITNQLQRIEELTEYLEVLEGQLQAVGGDYTVVYSLNGNYRVLGDFYLQQLTAIGIDESSYEQGGVWVKKGGETLCYASGSSSYEKYMKMEKGELYLKKEDAGTETDLSAIFLNGTNKRMVENGVNILVYDDKLGQIIDCAGCDVYAGTQIRHESIALDR